MDEVRLRRADGPGNWWRRNWFPLGWAVFGVAQSVVVGEVYPGSALSVVCCLYMAGAGVHRRRGWVCAGAEGIAWRGGFGAVRQLAWDRVELVRDESVRVRGCLVRRAYVTDRDGVVHRLPVPYSHSFSDPDPGFERAAAALGDLARRRTATGADAGRRAGGTD